ncbi:hypothetical protein NJB1507_23650 [Mycobacterium marinum]|uniref:hypothetical protein n=1 Tax=Mycobacterium marinum TaxID=1781 RepID=UPI0021C2A313|nr:hypothetical protein [Mycobacterium marinum]GJO23487.1 hypothetical protein NJB1507_23650 [Mycobacterium marinum]
MADSQRGKAWYQKLVRGLTGIFVLAAFIATAVASWWYTDGAFGKFSQTLGFPIAGVLFGVWAADYYYRKDIYEKRYRDVAVSVYTTWLLIAGVEAIKRHISKAKDGIGKLTPDSDDAYGHKLTAHSEIEAGHTAAELTIRMSYMALANLELFSEEAVKTGKEKFATDERDAGTRQRIIQGTGITNEHPEGTSAATNTAGNNANGGSLNG